MDLTIENSREAEIGREVRLTALWALCEAGLGGIGGFLQAPFIPILTGALSVLAISMLIWSTDSRSAPLFRAWLVVLLVKFAVNPLASPMSYVGFTFQPLFCLFIYRFITDTRKAAVIAGLVCVLERAFFKKIMSLAGGGHGGDVDLWNLKSSFSTAAISDRMFSEIMADNPMLAGAFYVALVGLGVYTGVLAYRLPVGIRDEQAKLDAMDPQPNLEELAAPPPKKKRRKLKVRKKRPKKDFTLSQLKWPGMLAGFGLFKMVSGNYQEGMEMFSFAMLFLVVFTQFLPQFFVPLVQNLILHLFDDGTIKMKHAAGAMPELRTCFQAAWNMAGQSEKNMLARVERFVPLFFGLALRFEPEPQPARVNA